MIDFKMPALGADMEAGTLVEWLVKPGDEVVPGAIVAVVETQKGAIEIETFNKGIVADILVPVGERVPVGAVLAHIDDGGGATAAPSSAPRAAAFVSEPAPTAPPTINPPPPPPSGRAPSTGRVKVTPAARRRAAELNLDLSRVSATGIQGSIRLADIEAFRPAETPRRTRTGFDAAQMRKAIAAAMSRAKREIPHYYLSDTIDMSRALAWLERFNAEQPPTGRLLPAALLLKASALALRQTPELNGTFVDGAFVPGAGIHIGWAVSLRGGGLIAPAIGDVDRKPLGEVMAAMRDVVQRARGGGLRGSELGTATITITDLGDRGAETVQAIIYPPQVAIIGFGRIATRPWATNERIEARPLITASLAADHRVTDGHKGGLFLKALRDVLQEPEAL